MNYGYRCDGRQRTPANVHQNLVLIPKKNVQIADSQNSTNYSSYRHTDDC